MAIAAKQVLANMHGFKRRVKHDKTTLPMVPKKCKEGIKLLSGSEGWGMHAIQGFSITRILSWMGTITLVGIVFAILWLVLVDKTALTNAFYLMGAFLTLFSMAMGVTQLLGDA